MSFNKDSSERWGDIFTIIKVRGQECWGQVISTFCTLTGVGCIWNFQSVVLKSNPCLSPKSHRPGIVSLWDTIYSRYTHIYSWLFSHPVTRGNSLVDYRVKWFMVIGWQLWGNGVLKHLSLCSYMCAKVLMYFIQSMYSFVKLSCIHNN